MGPAEGLAVATVATATVLDFRYRKVPNWLTVPITIIGFMLALLTNRWLGLADSCLGAAVGLLLLLVPFSMGWMGGGDVKLLMAVGACLGTRAVVWVALYGAVAGGIGALLLVLFRTIKAGELQSQLQLLLMGLRLTSWSSLASVRKSPSLVFPTTQAALKEKFPYAFAIAIGTLLVI